MLKTFPTAILQLPKRLKFASILKRSSEPGSPTVQTATTQADPSTMAADDDLPVPPGPPTSQLSSNAAKKRALFFPLGYKEAAQQWWTSVSSRQAERNVLSFVPYLREDAGSANASQLQDLAKADPFGQRVWRSSMVQLSGKDRALNELAIERVNEQADDTLVMLHGYGAGLGFFYKNFEPLSRPKGWKVYALDLLGMGNSARPNFRVKGKTQQEKTAEAESWFIDALEEWRRIRKIEKFTLMGHSLGGYLAVSYALKYPGHLNKLILASPAGIPEDPWAVNEALPEPSESRMSNEFTQDQESIVRREGMGTAKPNTATPPKRPLPGWFSYLWDANVSPFSIVRLTGPLGPRFVSGWTSRRFSHLPPEEKEALHTYSYALFRSKGSGEYALPYLLAPGAYARSPVINKIQDVGRQILKPATKDSPEVRETGFPIVFMYGENDWMDVAGGLAAEEKIKQRVVKALLHGTDEEKRRENGSAKVVVVTKAGHHLYIDNPDEFNSVILKEMEETKKWGEKQKSMT